jgi:hypothetical protein
MGAGASKAPPDITAKSLEAKRIAQEIFRFMISQMKFEEYLTLANPDQCKKYVILIADSLQKFFMKVKITPDKTKDGYIYFRKFDDVKGSTPMSQHYCMVIALFFVRIFQIYGALALSILDTDTNVYEFAHGGGLDELEAEDDGVQSGGGLPVLTEESLRPGETLPSPYAILMPYLRRFQGNTEYYKFTGYYIFLKMSPFIVDGLQQYGMFYLYEPGRAYTSSSNVGKILCNMRVELTDKGVKLILSGITIQEPKRKDIRLEDSTIRIQRSESGILGIGDYGNVGEILNRRFLDILREASRQREDDEDEDDKEKRERRPGYPYRPEEKKENTKIKEQFRTFALMERLKKMDSQPIKAHCIARALQLVSPKGLQKEFPQTIVSSICDSKFYSVKDKRFSQSLPAMDEKIVDAKGIFTLWQLFFDKVLPDMSPDMSDSTREKYKVASAYLSKAFGNPAPLHLKEVPSKTASSYCAGKRDKQLKVESKEAITALRLVVGKMIETQAMHTAKVMKILGKLFLIQPGKPITLHPNVLEGGLPAVNAIGEEARAILVAYYANCEALYGSGVQIVERSKAKILERYY